MKRILLLTCLLLSFSSLFARVWKDDAVVAFRDSVMREVEHMPADTSRLSRLMNIAYLYQYPPYNLFFANQLYEEARQQDNLFYENMGAYYIAICYDKKHHVDSLGIWVDKLKELAPRMGRYDFYLEQKAALSRAQASKRMIEKAVYIAKDVLEESKKRKSNNGMVAAYNSLACAYSVSSRADESLVMLHKGYQNCNRRTKLSLHIDILSRMISRYGDLGKGDSLLIYLKEMDTLLNSAISKEPKTINNWRDVMVDCQTKYVRYYMNIKDYPKAAVYIDKAKALLTPFVDPVYWLNVQLVELQYYGRIKEYDKGIALIDQVTPIVEKDYVSTFGVMIYFKSLLLRDKGDWEAAIQNMRFLLHKQDSLNAAFSASQLAQIKEIYHIDELLMEKQKIASTNYARAILILAVLLVLMVLFYLYTKSVSRKIAQAEKAAAAAAALSNADNQAKERLKLEISHDIRTPLNAVVGFAEILADADSLDEESKAAYNKIIQENATQLLDYVNNILELSRLESGKTKYTCEKCEFVSLFRQVIEQANKNTENCVRAELHTEVEEQIIDTDVSRLLLLLNSLVVSVVDTEFYHTDITIKRIKEKSLLLVQVANTPLGKERFENKTAMIRNEINAHFIHYFGGYYKVESQEKKGPVVIFAYPYTAVDKDRG